MTLSRLVPWKYQELLCHIRRQMPDALRIVCSDERVANDTSWERVDKFEWEKTVPRDEVKILDEESGD